MKKSLLSLALFFSLLVTGCHQPITQMDPNLPAPDEQEAQPSSPSSAVRSPQQPTGARSSTQRPDYVHMPESQPIAAEIVATEDILPSMGYVNDRIAQYSKKLERWRELDRQAGAAPLSQEQSAEMVDCFQQLQKVMNGYSILRGRMLDTVNPAARKNGSIEAARDLHRMDIDFLESNCGTLLAADRQKSGLVPGKASGSLGEVEIALSRHFNLGEYEAVNQLWQSLPADQAERLHAGAHVHYARALVYLDRGREAAAVYRRLIERMTATEKQANDLLSLRQQLADLLTAGGEFAQAEQQYQQIFAEYKKLALVEDWSKLQLAVLERGARDSGELREYADLLRRYLAYIPEKDGYTVSLQADRFQQLYPHSPVQPNVEKIKTQSKEQAERWMNGLVSSVDKLAAEKKYQDASRILNKVPEGIVDSEQKNVLREKNDAIVFAEAVDRETVRKQQEQELQRKWNSGLLLEKNERYDEAIAVFVDLQKGEQGDKARAKVAELELKAAQSDRRKAADLYIRYTKTADVDGKKKLLLESRRLLKDILVKYPNVEIAAKVASNIERVEQEMRTLDPNLLQHADRPGAPASFPVPPSAPGQPLGSVPVE